MPSIPIVIDTNVWSDLRKLLDEFKKIQPPRSYTDLWKLPDKERDELVSKFKEGREKSEQERRNRDITIYDRIREMVRQEMVSSEKYVIHVPSYVYNEVGRSVSSKITSTSKIDEKFLKDFEDFLDAIPLVKVEIKKKLNVGEDFPIKSTDVEKTKEIMESFLKKVKELNTIKLLDHLKNANDEQKIKVRKRTEKLQEKMRDVLHKYLKWDQPMIESSKIHIFRYETRTKSLHNLEDKIKNYEKVSDINFKENFGVLADRLTKNSEEFDFFDLQMCLYAKEEGAAIITKNTQVYQEINDPHFLGYFDDIKVMDPSINFDSLEDLEISDLIKIVDRSIEKDFRQVDVSICAELDSRLNEPAMEREGMKLIKAAESYYSLTKRPKELYTPLGGVLKFLRLENNQLKVSRKFISGDPSKSFFQILKYVDDNYFNRKLSESHFVQDNVPIESVRKKILKGKVLRDFLEEKQGVKEILEEFQGKKNYLEIFLNKYRGKPYQQITDLFTALGVKSHFSSTEIIGALAPEPPSESLSLNECPSTGGGRKRETAKCLLEWEQIEEFNEEKLEKRDPQKVKIDSQKFLEHLRAVKNPQERKQLIEFADQVLNLAEDHTSKISGPNVREVTHIINNHKVLNHFSKVHRVSSALSYGFFAKNLLGDILHGNVEGVAFNVGFLAGGEVLSKLSSAMLSNGVKYAEAGKLMLGNSMKYASPFVSRFLSPLIALDLYDQIKDLEAGDKDALVGVIGDSIFLIIDAVDIGVSILEIAGLIAEVSSVTGPIGMAIGAVVMIATDVYLAVRKVDKVDRIIHLTTGERWEMFATTFFTFGLVKLDVERLVPIKDANNKLAQQALEALKKSQDIQRIVVPSAVWRGENDIEIAENNKFTPYLSESNVKWHRVRPDDPERGRIFCAPEGDWENPPSWIMARCGNAIGVADLTPKKQNYTLFSLGDGEDQVQGFKDSPNIFRIGRGKKYMRGGDKNDVFILEEGTTFDYFPAGNVLGAGGSNLLDLRGIYSEDPVGIVFNDEPITARIFQVTNLTSRSYYQPNIYFYNITSIIGRENEVDIIYTNCSTKYVDGRGGSSDFADQIHISHTYKECNHDKVIQLGPNTMLINEAVTGNFSYFVNDVHSNVRCTLKKSLTFKPSVKDPENNLMEHKFFVNGTLSDIIKFEFHRDENHSNDIDIRMYFKDENGKINGFHLDTILGDAKNTGGMDNLAIYLKDNAELRYHHNGIYALLKSKKPVMDIIKKYQPIAIDFGISIFILAEKENAIVSIGNEEKDHVLYNDPSYKTYLVGTKGNNAYIVVSGQDVLHGPDPPKIPDIEIYSTESEIYTSTLDLHYISKQMKQDLGQELLMKHVFDSEKIVLYLYAFDRNTAGANAYTNVTKITIRSNQEGIKRDFFCAGLQVILNKAPVLLRCDDEYQKQFGNIIDFENDVLNYDSSNYYTPLSLFFNNYEIIAINKEDVEPNTGVFFERKLGRYRFLRLEDDLILTNGFDFDVPAYRPITVVLKNFYQDPAFFQTILFMFRDTDVFLTEEIDNIEGAIPLEDWYEEYEYTSNNIMGDLNRRSRRDLEYNQGHSNMKRFSESEQSHLLSTNIFGTVFHFLSNKFHNSFNHLNDYVKSLASSIPILNQQELPSADFLNKNMITVERIFDSKTNIPLSNENKITNTDLNSTLLLLDILVRKLSDSKYKLPTENYFLLPQEQVQKKMVELTGKLGLDYNDIEGSLEKQQQRILNNFKDQ